MTTASTLAQVASFATTSRSRRPLAACVSSDFMNAKTSSFWNVTAASQRFGAATGAGAGAGRGGGAASRCAGGGTGRDSGAGCGSGAAAQDASSQRKMLAAASFSLLKGPSWSWTCSALSSCAQLLRLRESYTTWASGKEISRGKIARSRTRIRWFDRSQADKISVSQRPRPDSKKTRSHGSVRQGNSSRQPGRGDAPLLPRLRDERDRGARAAGRARRPQARAPARALRDARVEQRLEPPLREMRPRGGRGPG